MTSLLAPLAGPRAPWDGGAAAPADEAAARLPGGQATESHWRSAASFISVLLAAVVWALPVTHGTGGREVWVLTLGLLSLLPGLVLVRPWSTVPVGHLVVAVLPSVAALVVCLTSPTGFDGLDETASFVYCGGLYVVARGWATEPLRRRALLLFLALAGLEQFTQAYLPWWGSGDVSTLMTGTFYWHNQFAAFMLGTGLVATVLAVRGSGLLRTVGWAAAPWCLAAMFFAGSRAGLAILVLCWLVLGVLALLDRRGRVAMVALAAIALGLATALSSPWLMETSGSATSTVQAREADQSTEGNGQSRLYLWRAAAEVGLERPVTGGGFDSFSGAGSAHMPAGQTLSVYAHNGYLQAFSDGGLVLLLSLLAATGLPAMAAFRLLWSRRRGDDVLGVAVPVAMLGLLLHTGVDFDWAYPSLLGLLALLAALLPDHRRAQREANGWSRLPVGVLVVLTLLAVPAAARASALKATAADVPGWLTPVAAVLPLHGSVDWLPAVSPCRAELASDDPVTRRHGLRCTVDAAADDPGLQLARARAQVAGGSVTAGLDAADVVMDRYGTSRPSLGIQHALVLAEAGRTAQALQELARLRADYAAMRRAAEVEDIDRLVESLTTR